MSWRSRSRYGVQVVSFPCACCVGVLVVHCKSPSVPRRLILYRGAAPALYSQEYMLCHYGLCENRRASRHGRPDDK